MHTMWTSKDIKFRVKKKDFLVMHQKLSVIIISNEYPSNIDLM